MALSFPNGLLKESLKEEWRTGIQESAPPQTWEGGRGGHHLSGNLIFPTVSQDARSIKLIIKDIYGVSQREFLWALK
jgi:hypothetical protein